MIGAVDPNRIGDNNPSRPATMLLITAGADPTDVQRALRHSSLRIAGKDQDQD